MTCHLIATGELEAYAFGERSPAAGRALEGHLFGCAACAAELRHLRSERRLFRARAETSPDPLELPPFADVLARITRSDDLGETRGGLDEGHGDHLVPERTPLDDQYGGGLDAERHDLDGGRDRLDDQHAGSLDAEQRGSLADDLVRVAHESGLAAGQGSEPARAIAPRPRRRMLSATVVTLAVAAAVAWLWLGRPAQPGPEAARGDDAAAEILPEPICAANEPGEDGEDGAPCNAHCEEDDVTADEPRVSLPPDGHLDLALARYEEDVGACVAGASRSPETPMTSACEDAIAWCSVGRP